MEVVCMKVAGNLLAPLDEQSAAAISKLKLAQGVTVTIKRLRNPLFHRKYFALLNLAFESWEPGNKEYKGQQIAKNFEQFREDVTILAGHYTQSVRLDGSIRTSAKSISFANMSPEDFETLYQSTLTVILERVLRQYSREDLNRVIDQILGFA